jgi:hypothetical protein
VQSTSFVVREGIFNRVPLINVMAVQCVQWYVLWGGVRCLFSGMFYGAWGDVFLVVCFMGQWKICVQWYVIRSGEKCLFTGMFCGVGRRCLSTVCGWMSGHVSMCVHVSGRKDMHTLPSISGCRSFVFRRYTVTTNILVSDCSTEWWKVFNGCV